MNRKILAVGLLGAVLLGGGLAIALYLRAPAAPPQAVQTHSPPKDARYVTLDKMVVMLKEPTGTRIRYAAIDLAFEVSGEAAEKKVRAQLPLLRSIVHETVTRKSADDMRALGHAELAGLLEKACIAGYGGSVEPPFERALLTRLVIE